MKNERYGIIFDTSENSHYYYDSGTGKVISCNSDEKDLIDKILTNQMSLKDACTSSNDFFEFITSENLFSNVKWSFLLPTKKEFTESIKGKCEQIVLELTEACNLRCDYCIYNEHHPNFRHFSNKNMDFDVAKKSIDYVLKDYVRDEFALTFYGGEPLINYNLMEKCMEYVKSYYSHIKMTYSFTTNLTLLNQEMIEYFNTLEEINIVCSLDGPQSVHDKYRKNRKGEGSFEKAIANFNKLLIGFYNPKKKRTLSINCVLVPPYKQDKLEELNDFFYNILNIPKEIECNYSYVDLGEMMLDVGKEVDEERLLQLSPLEEWAANDFVIKKDNSDFFNVIGIELSRIGNRQITKHGNIETSYLHGNCIPGQRRIYVTVDGDFKTCEKVGDIPILGDYINGYNYDKSYKVYIEDYAKYFEEKCSDCWARTMCGVCYEQTVGVDKDSPYISGKLCETSREITKDMFINYYRLHENDKVSLERALSELEIR